MRSPGTGRAQEGGALGMRMGGLHGVGWVRNSNGALFALCDRSTSVARVIKREDDYR